MYFKSIATATASSLLIGCSSTPLVLPPIGPNQSGAVSMAATGQLEVFSAKQKCRDGNEYDPNPAWYQHTQYNVYDMNGKRIHHVFNTVGHYDEAPSRVTLPAGMYLVRARAKGFMRVDVPVVIEPGRTTRVHLDGDWKPPRGIRKTELVSSPGGYAVGWSAGLTNETGIN